MSFFKIDKDAGGSFFGKTTASSIITVPKKDAEEETTHDAVEPIGSLDYDDAMAQHGEIQCEAGIEEIMETEQSYLPRSIAENEPSPPVLAKAGLFLPPPEQKSLPILRPPQSLKQYPPMKSILSVSNNIRSVSAMQTAPRPNSIAITAKPILEPIKPLLGAPKTSTNTLREVPRPVSIGLETANVAVSAPLKRPASTIALPQRPSPVQAAVARRPALAQNSPNVDTLAIACSTQLEAITILVEYQRCQVTLLKTRLIEADYLSDVLDTMRDTHELYKTVTESLSKQLGDLASFV